MAWRNCAGQHGGRGGSSISRVLCTARCAKPCRLMTIPLGRLLPAASRSLPERQLWKPSAAPQNGNCRRPYLALLQVGFTLPPPLPGARCALTAPFRPGPQAARRSGGWYDFCGTVPKVTLAGRYPAPCFHGARTFLYCLSSSGHPTIRRCLCSRLRPAQQASARAVDAAGGSPGSRPARRPRRHLTHRLVKTAV